MTRFVNLAGCFSLLLLPSLGCNESKECERARVQLAGQWERLRDNAAKRKTDNEGSPASDLARWQKIEEQAELVQTSFQTEQVTWTAAENGTRDIQEQYAPLKGSDALLVKGFGKLMQEALQELKEYEKTCR